MPPEDPCDLSNRASADSLNWDDPGLSVSSDPLLRRRYRRLQSWYRERVLGADYGYSGSGSTRRPVGSMLSDEAVVADRALNFFCDDEILEYVDRRAPEVVRAGGTLDEHRLRHNMLSSMPMAFSLAAVLGRAPDRVVIVNELFGLDAVEVTSVEAEWSPEHAMSYLADRTAFDVSIRYRLAGDRNGVIGLETKYTEPLSQTEYNTPRYGEVTKDCGWFRAGAAGTLVARQTNQLWRNAMLAASLEVAGDVVQSQLAVIGLRDDESLRASTNALREFVQDGPGPRRIVDLSWEELVDRLVGSSVASFAARFYERYLDLSVLDRLGDPIEQLRRPRRSTVGSDAQRRWHFSKVPSATRPATRTAGEQIEWGRWLPTVWRAANDPVQSLTVPARSPQHEAFAWWTPLVHLSLYSFGWVSPTLALDRWDRAGRPLDDRRLALIEAVWGWDLDAMLQYLVHGHNLDGTHVSTLPGTRRASRGHAPVDIARGLPVASHLTPNPAMYGDSDPLHLAYHCDGPVSAWDRSSVRLTKGDSRVAGPPRATLVCERALGWYAALHALGGKLAPHQSGHGWRVDVVVTPVGSLGTFRRSARSGRWFAGQHRWHELGTPDA